MDLATSMRCVPNALITDQMNWTLYHPFGCIHYSYTMHSPLPVVLIRLNSVDGQEPSVCHQPNCIARSVMLTPFVVVFYSNLGIQAECTGLESHIIVMNHSTASLQTMTMPLCWMESPPMRPVYVSVSHIWDHNYHYFVFFPGLWLFGSNWPWTNNFIWFFPGLWLFVSNWLWTNNFTWWSDVHI